MRARFGESTAAQKDGNPPEILALGTALGDSGVWIAHVHYHGGAYFRATPVQHLLSFASRTRIHRSLAGKRISHDAHEGSLAICPAGADTSVDAEGDLKSIVVMVRSDKLALAAAEAGTLEARLGPQATGHDRRLLELAWTLTEECRDGFPQGAIFWNETAGRLVETLALNQTVGAKADTGRPLDIAALGRLKEFILAHLDESLNVAALARMTDLSQFHFSRLFARTVGVSPYQYVLHLRLRRAVELVRDGRLPLADIAMRTGFADQSHLTRWVRRVHGVSLSQLGPKQNRHELAPATAGAGGQARV